MIVSGNFTTAGDVSEVLVPETGDHRQAGQFNILLDGAVTGTIVLERAFRNPDGTFTPFFILKSYVDVDANEVGAEPETGVRYRLRMTVGAAQDVDYRLSN